ncbi:MAG: hypothetical protein EWV82_12420 [Microcystis aeruginosa Ma_AC_P_19900807_S299]|nr:MAG: hypothetical protein EWV82_12420 [Microcystis aeruginosa Ma_AC_P_19900807_S299]
MNWEWRVGRINKNNLLSLISCLLSPVSYLLSPVSCKKNECFINTDVDGSCIECRRMDSGDLVSVDLWRHQ